MRLLLPLFLASVLAAGEAADPRTRDYAEIDAHALKAGRADTASVAALAKFLGRASPEPVDRARAAFRWITDGIAYGRGGADAATTLKHRQAVCAGYSALFAALCGELEVPCRTVIGQVKHQGRLMGHAWNAIELDGKWYLVDCTWGAGCIGPQGYRKRFEPGYFLADPAVLATSHRPREDRWQLRDPPLSAKEFMALPRLLPAFGAAGFALDSHPADPITAKGEVAITFKRTGKARLSALLCFGVKALPRGYVLAVNDSTASTVRVACPNPGKYDLWLLADGEFAGAYRIVQTDPAKNVVPDFPHFFGTYHQSKVELIEPLTGKLERGAKVTFRVTAPGQRVVLIAGGRPRTLSRARGSDECSLTVAVPAGEVYLAVPGKTAGDWNVLVGYNLKR